MGSHLKGVYMNRVLNKYNELLTDRNIEIIKAFKYKKTIGQSHFLL